MTQEIEVKVNELRMKVDELELNTLIMHKRIKALEALINARQAPDTAGHPNDGGGLIEGSRSRLPHWLRNSSMAGRRGCRCWS